MPRPADPGLAAALQRSPGTVTDFLERVAGEPIDADVRSQRAGPARRDNQLGLAAGAELLYRSVLLVGPSAIRIQRTLQVADTPPAR